MNLSIFSANKHFRMHESSKRLILNVIYSEFICR